MRKCHSELQKLMVDHGRNRDPEAPDGGYVLRNFDVVEFCDKVSQRLDTIVAHVREELKISSMVRHVEPPKSGEVAGG